MTRISGWALVGAVLVGGSALAVLASGRGSPVQDTVAPAPVVSPNVAVLDFTSPDTGSRTDPWSYGLADFAIASLQERGVSVLERRALRGILAERDLEQAGLLAAGPVLSVELPQLRYLVGGSIEALDAERFRLVVSAFDVRTAELAMEASADGGYPADLDEALGELVDRLLARLRPDAASRPRGERIGFTRQPDVAIQFYKGVDHSLHGRPEFAAEYFRQAWLADRSFQIAAIWRMRAYEQLGLDDLAAYVRDGVLQDTQGRQLFQLVAPSLAHQRGKLVVAMSRSTDAEPHRRRLEAQVADALAEQPGIGLFSAAWIRSLAEELDLRLSGEIAPYDLERQAWLGVDALVRVSWTAAGSAGGGSLRLELLDAVSGDIVAREEERGEEASLSERLPMLVSRLTEAPHRRFQSQRALRELMPLDYPLPPGDIAVYTRERYAYLLRDFADHPKDLKKLARHAEMHGIHSHAKYEPDIYDKEWPYLELLWKRMLAGVDASDPDAPNWLSLALWKLRFHGFHNGDGDSPHWWYNRGKRVPPVAEHFEPLLRAYPESLAALCVRYSIALEHVMWGRHEEAAKLLRALAASEHEAGGLSLDLGISANIFFMAALEAARVGDGNASARWADEAARLADLFADSRPVNPVIPAVVYSPPGRGGHVDGGFYVASMPKTIFVDRRMRFMRGEALNPRIRSLARGGPGVVSEPSLGDRYRAATRQKGKAGASARLAYLEMLAGSIAAGEPLDMAVYYSRPFDTIVPWLHEHLPAEERPAFEAAVEELVRQILEHYRLDANFPMRLYAAAGMDDAVLAMAEPLLAGRDDWGRVQAVTAKAQILSRREDPARGARFARTELQRFEDDYPERRGMKYLDLVHLSAGLFEEAGRHADAARVYRRGLAAPLFEAGGWLEGESRARHHRASLRYRLALIEKSRGNALEAASLLRQVIESAEAQPDWQLHHGGHGSGSVGTLGLYRAALAQLSELRGEPAANDG